jgi:hypothetical protein
MSGSDKAIMYQDDLEPVPEGGVFYPEALRRIEPFLAMFNRDEILQPKVFNANIELYLDSIIGLFRSFHDTHRAALAVYESYRACGSQYCLYLRNFRWAGMALGRYWEGTRLVEAQGYSAKDRYFRQCLKSALTPDIATLSFINIFDIYPSGLEKDDGYLKEVMIPSLRVLSHNWREVVREVVRGANLIILNVLDDSEGVTYEAALLAECRMADRTILTGENLAKRHIASMSQFHQIIDLTESPPDPESQEGRNLVGAIQALSADDFRQTNQVSDLSMLRCWVIDRHIDAAMRQADPQTLAGVPYDLFIPYSMRTNWKDLTRFFPEVVEHWEAIERKAMGKGRLPGTEELANTMYEALRVFYLAVTLERYYEMAMSLSIIGMAHRTITRRLDIMTVCYSHAAECAGWSGDTALTTFLQGALQELTKAASGRPLPP